MIYTRSWRLIVCAALAIVCSFYSISSALAGGCPHGPTDQDFGGSSVEDQSSLDSRRFRWKANHVLPQSATEQISGLFLALRNSGKLRTRWVEYDTTVDLQTFVGRSSFWVGTPTLALDGLLCDLNQKYCHRDLDPVIRQSDDLLSHLSGTSFSQPQWQFRSVKDQTVCLQVPDITLEIGNEVAKIPDIGGRKGARNTQVVEKCSNFGGVKICIPRVEFSDPIGRENGFFLEQLPSGSTDLAWIRTFAVDITIPERPLPAYLDIRPGGFSSRFPDASAYFETGYHKLGLNIGSFLASEGGARVESISMADSSKSVVDGKSTPYIYKDNGNLLKWSQGGKSRIIIAVIDTAARLDRCDFDKSVLVDTSDFISPKSKKTQRLDVKCVNSTVAADEVEHGTHILGMFAAVPPGTARNNLVRLPNYGLLYFPLDLLQMRTSLAYRDKLAAWIKEAAYVGNASVFNMSWSYTPDIPADSPFRDPIKDAIEELRDQALFVVAAGERGVDPGTDYDAGDDNRCALLPACYDGPNVISVVAVEQTTDGSVVPIQRLGRLETNIGSRFFSVSAPGRDVVSTVLLEGYSAMSGTSQAAPMVAVVAAQLFAKQKLKPADVKNRIIVSGEMAATLLDISKGGIPNVPTAINGEGQYIKAAGGCEMIVKSSKLLEATNFENQPLELASDDGPILSIGWPEVKRFVNVSDDRYLIFYEDDNKDLVRTTGVLSDASKSLLVRVTGVKKDQSCNAAQKKKIAVSDLTDFVGSL